MAGSTGRIEGALMARKDALRQEYLAGLCATLRDYVLAGHEVHVRTEQAAP